MTYTDAITTLTDLTIDIWAFWYLYQQIKFQRQAKRAIREVTQ